MYTVIDAEKKFMKGDADNNGVCQMSSLNVHIGTLSYLALILSNIRQLFYLKFLTHTSFQKSKAHVHVLNMFVRPSVPT